MKRIHLLFAVLGTVTIYSAAWALPPDQVANSPVPALRETARDRDARFARAQMAQRAAAARQTLAAPAAAPGITAPNVSGAREQAEAGVTSPGGPSPGLQEDAPASTGGDVDSQRAAIWNSPEMQGARAWVIEYSRRSAQSSVSEGRQFLMQLSQLSPEEMRNWVERYRHARGRRAAQQNVEENARRLMLEQAITRQEATRQSFDHFNQYRSEAADWMRQRFQTQSQLSQQLRHGRAGARDAGLRADLEQNFDPFDPTFDQHDPASLRGWGRKWAASASLPGDLPAGDPRNRVVDVVDIGPNGGGTVVLEGGGRVPNDGGASDAAAGAAAGGAGGGDGAPQ